MREVPSTRSPLQGFARRLLFALLWLIPSMAAAQTLASASFSPTSVKGGTSTTCTVKLSSAAGASGFVVSVANTHSWVHIPTSITVPSGATSKSVAVPIGQVASDSSATVTFTAGAVTLKPSIQALKSVAMATASVSPTVIQSGGTAIGTVKLTNPAPDGGYVVAVVSSQSFVKVPPTMTVPAGSQIGTFTVNTTAVTSLKSATISFTANSLTIKCSVQVSYLVDVLTNQYDKYRTGANLREVFLNTSNVNSTKFGKLFSLPVDGQIYSQPLVATGLNLGAQGTHNIVYVCTQHNSIYAFDADSGSTTAYWHKTYGSPFPQADLGVNEVTVELGILSTPVIDKAAGAMYFTTHSKLLGLYYIQLHAVSLTTGNEIGTSPTTIQTSVLGSGEGGDGITVPFSAFWHMQRPGILLDHGRLYLAFASHGDREPYHGWIMAYAQSNLARLATYCTTRNGLMGGVWQSGCGLTADDAGNIYFLSGNGDFTHNTTGGMTGNSVVKLAFANNSFTVSDFFTPKDSDNMNDKDLDLGCSGALLIPGTSLLIGSAKDGSAVLVNSNNMGKFDANADHCTQRWAAFAGKNHGFVYWNASDGNASLYGWGGDDQGQRFKFNGSTVVTNPLSITQITNSDGQGYSLSLSANGSTAGTGILWAVDAGGWTPSPGILRAYDATNLQHELWNTEMVASRDRLGNGTKFCPPTVANGKVYMATTSNKLMVYGRLP